MALAIAIPATTAATAGTSDALAEICWINNTNDYGSGCETTSLSCEDLGMRDGQVVGCDGERVAEMMDLRLGPFELRRRAEDVNIR